MADARLVDLLARVSEFGLRDHKADCRLLYYDPIQDWPCSCGKSELEQEVAATLAEQSVKGDAK